MPLTQLPPEVLLHICAAVEPCDLGRLPQTCRSLRQLIHGNSLLYKQLYTKHWDDPASHPLKRELCWEKEVKHIAPVLKLLQSSDNQDLKNRKLPAVANAVTSLLATATTDPRSHDRKNISQLNNLIDVEKRQDNVQALLCQSALFKRARNQIHQGVTREEEQRERERQRASAKLHCLYGVPILNPTEDIHMYPYAVSTVYDLRGYKESNGWGPFLDDGSWRVDWEKVEAILLVLGYNLRRIDVGGELWLAGLWHTPFLGSSGYSYRPITPRCPHGRSGATGPYVPQKYNPELAKKDPYGITGTWLRIVCFLDYRDLYDYNFGRLQPAPTSPRRPLSATEAVRLIVMSLVVSKIEYPEEEDEEEDEDDSTRADVPASAIPQENRKRAEKAPVVHFEGTARALHSAWDPNANSIIRGTVSTTAEGEIRWTSVSVYDGDEERWKSEGIQVGGVQSARGVLGNWFARNYDPHGPAGPTAFWKIRDEVRTDQTADDDSDEE